MVRAPAKTGNLRISKKIVTKILQINILSLFIFWITDRILIMVTMKLILPRILLIPATWREKIIKSTLNLLDPNSLDKGGYIVHPAATPLWIFNDIIRNHSETGRSQKDKALSRGNTKSGVFIRIGSIQLPKNPMRAGIIKKKIISNAWLVTIVL